MCVFPSNPPSLAAPTADLPPHLPSMGSVAWRRAGGKYRERQNLIVGDMECVLALHASVCGCVCVCVCVCVCGRNMNELRMVWRVCEGVEEMLRTCGLRLHPTLLVFLLGVLDL